MLVFLYVCSILLFEQLERIDRVLVNDSTRDYSCAHRIEHRYEFSKQRENNSMLQMSACDSSTDHVQCSNRSLFRVKDRLAMIFIFRDGMSDANLIRREVKIDENAFTQSRTEYSSQEICRLARIFSRSVSDSGSKPSLVCQRILFRCSSSSIRLTSCRNMVS
jgi:hypothetical protein